MSSDAAIKPPSTQRLVSAGAVMAAGTMISRILGFVRVALLAFVLGNGSRQADMYGIATTIPTSLYILFAGGALNTVLVPQLVRAVQNDEDGGEAYTNRIMTAFLMIVGLVAGLLTLMAPWIIHLYSSDRWRTPEMAAHYQSMILLGYLCLPEIFFYGVFFLLGQVLNARDHFGPMMWAPIANNVVQVAVLLTYFGIWGRSPGVDPFTGPQAWLLGGGATFGIITQTLVMVWFLRKSGFRYRPRFDLRGTGLGHTFELAKWTLGFVLVNQLALIVVDKLATSATVATGSGAGLTVYNNAYLIWILPHSLITVSLATAMLPSASRMAAAGDMVGVRDEMQRTMRLAGVVLVPAAAAFIALANPLAHLLFGHGSGAQDARFVGWTLIAFAIGLVPFTMQYICLRAFYAVEDTRSTFYIQCIIAALNVVFALVLVVPYHRAELIAPGLALAYSLSYVIGVGLSWRRLRQHLPELDSRPVLRYLGKVTLAVTPAAVVAWAITSWLDSSLLMQLLGFVLAGVVAVGLYLAVAKLLHIPEVNDILGIVLRRGRGAKQSPAEGDAAVTPESLAEAAEGLAVGETPGQDPDRTQPNLPVVAAASQGHEVSVNSSVDETTDPIDLADSEDTAEDVHPIQVKPGLLLGSRYRLEEVLVRRAVTQTWKAFDEVLSRAVLIHLLPPEGDENAELMEAARKAAVATDSRFLRVLDAAMPTELDQFEAENMSPGADHEPLGPYIVCEYAPGQSLEQLLASGPLSALESAWLVREVADALVGMHAQGLYHERINPDTVVITATGNIKIVGFLLEAELAPTRQKLPVEYAATPELTDVIDLGRLLYATLVQRWPGIHGYGMAAAPRDAEGNLLTPRQVRAGVSPTLDRICDRILSQEPRQNETRLTTAAQVVRALTEVLGTADAAHDLERRMRYPVPVVRVRGQEPPTVDPEALPRTRASFADYADTPTGEMQFDPDTPTGEMDYTDPMVATPITADEHEEVVPAAPLPPKVRAARRPRASRRGIKVLVGLVLLVLLGSLIAVALRQGESKTAPEPSPTPAHAVVRPVKTVADFDPQGDNRRENPQDAPLAADGKPETAWRTMSYRNATMDKDGLGLILDLGAPVTVSTVKLQLVNAGADVEIRVPKEPAGNNPPTNSGDQWREVGKAQKAPEQLTITTSEVVSTRYVLIWFTQLPAEGSNHRGGVAEVEISG